MKARLFPFLLISRRMCLNHTFVFVSFDDFRVGSLTKEQVDCTEDNTLSGTGLTRDNRETTVKSDVQFIYQREVLNV